MTTIEIEKLLRKRVADDIDREKWGILAHDALAAVLKERWNGKKITARIINQFEDKFFELTRIKPTVYLDKSFGQMNLQAWGFGTHTSSSDKLILFIGYDSEPTEPRLAGACYMNYRAEAFEETDLCHGEPARERNTQRQELLRFDSNVIPEIAMAKAEELAAQKKLNLLTSTGPGERLRYSLKDLS